MNILPRCCTAALLTICFVYSAFAQNPPVPPKAVSPASQNAPAAGAPTREQVLHLLDLMGAKKLMTQMLDNVFDMEIRHIKQLRPDIPAAFWDDFAADARKSVHVEDLMDVIVPIYQRHFSNADIDGLIAFYQSQLGRKLTAELPQVQMEAMQAGGQWGATLGKEIGERAARRMAEQGYKSGTPPKPPE
jgi:hypothetical protein